MLLLRIANTRLPSCYSLPILIPLSIPIRCIKYRPLTYVQASSGTARVLHLQAEIASLLEKLDERTARLQKVQIELAELKSAQGNLLAEKGEINAKLRKAVEESGSLSFKVVFA